MIHKLRPFRVWEESHQRRRREVIGLIGTHHGVGVTYTGLMLSFYMAEDRGRRTAYLECNQHQDMMLIRSSYDWSSEEEHSFSFHRVTCYPEVKRDQIATVLNDDYECIVLDFGTDYINNRDELLRCDVKIVMSGKSAWEILKLKNFVNETELISGSDSWLYFIPQASDRVMRIIKKEVDREVIAVPFIEEPVLPSKIINHFFDRIL